MQTPRYDFLLHTSRIYRFEVVQTRAKPKWAHNKYLVELDQCWNEDMQTKKTRWKMSRRIKIYATFILSHETWFYKKKIRCYRNRDLFKAAMNPIKN